MYCVMNILNSIFPYPSIGYLLDMPFDNSALLSILGCRMIFNLVEAGGCDVNGGTNRHSSRTSPLSDMEFS